MINHPYPRENQSSLGYRYWETQWLIILPRRIKHYHSFYYLKTTIGRGNAFSLSLLRIEDGQSSSLWEVMFLI